MKLAKGKDGSIRDYFNSKAAIWDKEMAEKDSAKLEAMSQRLSIKPGASVLDVGTGTGIFVPYILKVIGPEGRLVCLDFCQRMLDVAGSKGFPANVTFLCADITESGLPGKSFEAAVCYGAFPHFEDKPKSLREINRVLKPGGELFICHTSSRSTINYLHRSIPEVCDHFLPDIDDTRWLLHTAGFVEITVSERRESYFASARKPA